MRKFALSNAKSTEQFGASLATYLTQGDVIALKGDLGAGKTTLTRGLIRSICGEGTDVPSPTYTLVQAYDGPLCPIWHFDLYRLSHPDEVFELGWTDTMYGIALIEWPDRAGTHLPKHRLTVHLETSGDGRCAILEPMGEDWQSRLDGFDFDAP